MFLLGNFCGNAVGEGHKLVDDNQGDTKTSTESEDLLAYGVAKGSGTMGFLTHDFGHGRVGDDLASTLDDVAVQVADQVGRNI